MLDVGDATARICHQVAAPLGQVDQLGPAVGRVGPTGQIAHVGEIVDEFGCGRQAQLCPVGKLGEPDAAHPDVAEDLEVRFADIAVPGVGAGSGQVIAELAQQPDQQLSDGQPLRRESLDFAMVSENTTVTEVSGSEVNWRRAMITPSPDFVSTDLARLHVRRTGTGPPVVLWHSLFFDSRSWGPLIDELARHRTVYAIDGPSHGKSEAVPRDFTFEELVVSAEQALDRLGLTEPVDWVGNAWGGHVGIRLATGARLRTLTTIGTPVQGIHVGGEAHQAWPLVGIYRFAGPTGFIVKQLFDSLVGRNPLPRNRIRLRASSRHSAKPTATGCITPCDR